MSFLIFSELVFEAVPLRSESIGNDLFQVFQRAAVDRFWDQAT